MSSNPHVVVVGAGPGGYAAAFYAADLGMRVTLVDPATNPGGVCLYRGCIPSKALLHVAKLIDEAKHAEAWGVSFGAPQIDLDRLRGFKEKVVNQLTGGLGQLSKQRKIAYVQGTAAFRDARTLEITSEGKPPSTLGVRLCDDRHGLASGDGPRAVDRQPARDGFDGRARAARHPQVAAGRRRRLHRPGTGQRLCRGRHEGHRGRDDRGAAAGRGPRPREHPRQEDREDVRGRSAQHQGRGDEGGEGRDRRHLRR